MRPRADTEKRFPMRNAAGKRQCRECGKERPEGARWHSWCSKECVDTYKIRAWPHHARKAAARRDKGVCALCGFDTSRIGPWLMKMPSSHGRASLYALAQKPMRIVYGQRDRYALANTDGALLGRHRARALTLLGRLWGVALTHGAHFAEVDHIVPVAEGGGGCGLDNLRTLCRKCHKRETDALKARLARRPTKGVGRGF